MQILNLQTPPPPRNDDLAANAVQPVIALQTAIAELQSELDLFGATNDNRTRITALAEIVMDCANELETTPTWNAVEHEAEELFAAYKTRLASNLFFLKVAADQVFTDDAASQFPLRIFKKSVGRLTWFHAALTVDNDNRPAFLAGVGEVRSRLEDLLAMNPRLSEGTPAAVERACDELTRSLLQKIPTAAPAATPPLGMNAERARFLEAFDELLLQLGYTGSSHEVLQSDRWAVLSSFKGLRQNLVADLSVVLDREQLTAQLRDLEVQYKSLTQRMFRAGDSPFRHPAADLWPWVEGRFAALRAMVQPPPVVPLPEPGLMTKIAQLAGWEE